MASSINEDEIRSKDPSIHHFPAPHKYASSGAHSFSSSMSIQDELLLSSGGLSNESGYASMTGSRKDSSTSSNSTLSSYSIRRESFGRRMSRKDSSLSTWSSPEYDVAPSEIHGGSTLFWSMSPYSSLLLQPKEILNIPEEAAGLEERDEPPHPQKGEPSLNNKYHQNYKDIFKEIFAILRKAQY